MKDNKSEPNQTLPPVLKAALGAILKNQLAQKDDSECDCERCIAYRREEAICSLVRELVVATAASGLSPDEIRLSPCFAVAEKFVDTVLARQQALATKFKDWDQKQIDEGLNEALG